MEINGSVPKHIALASHPIMTRSQDDADAIRQYIQKLGIADVYSAKINDPTLLQKVTNGEFDLVIAVGGDGTMLRAGRLFGPLHIPILGINDGNFGFLTEIHIDGYQSSLLKVLEGKYRIENRMMLKVEHVRGEKTLGTCEALNEVVICRGQVVRPIRLVASVEDYTLATYVADGLIVATPTGSTAYALAAGGPILPPEMRNLLIIPVAPHLSVDRAVILSEGVTVKVIAHTTHEAVMSVDGQNPVLLQEGDIVYATASENTASFVRLQDPGYFYRNLMNYMEQNPSSKDIQ